MAQRLGKEEPNGRAVSVGGRKPSPNPTFNERALQTGVSGAPAPICSLRWVFRDRIGIGQHHRLSPMPIRREHPGLVVIHRIERGLTAGGGHQDVVVAIGQLDGEWQSYPQSDLGHKQPDRVRGGDPKLLQDILSLSFQLGIDSGPDVSFLNWHPSTLS